MFLSKLKILFVTLFLSSATWASAPSDPAVVKNVDLTKYVGLWHEIAHAPNFFQKGCIRSTAEYKIIDESSITVQNVCFKENGKTTDISGVARVTNLAVPAKLRVKFSFFQRGDYWITHLDSQYQWAVVSAPKKKSLFILSRTFPMDQAVLNDILLRLKIDGFETQDLVYDHE